MSNCITWSFFDVFHLIFISLPFPSVSSVSGLPLYGINSFSVSPTRYLLYQSLFKICNQIFIPIETFLITGDFFLIIYTSACTIFLTLFRKKYQTTNFLKNICVCILKGPGYFLFILQKAPPHKLSDCYAHPLSFSLWQES